MKRIFLIAVAAIVFSAPAINLNPAAATDQGDSFSQILSSLRTTRAHSLTAQGRATSDQCCKICRQGKACGDTCISRQDVCHVGPGCACDGQRYSTESTPVGDRAAATSVSEAL